MKMFVSSVRSSYSDDVLVYIQGTHFLRVWALMPFYNVFSSSFHRVTRVFSNQSLCHLWSIGLLVHWTIGPLVHWSISPLVYWSIGSLDHCSTGLWVHWAIGLLVHWIECQISNVNKVKLLLERTFGVPPVIFSSDNLTYHMPILPHTHIHANKHKLY